MDNSNNSFDDERQSPEEGTSKWDLPDRGLVMQVSEEIEDEDDDDDVQAPIIQGGYDPKEYEEYATTDELREIFSHISKYVPQMIELHTRLAPFIPEIMPSVGDIDGFLKVPRPDGKDDTLGLTVLDEPCTTQSDPAVLQLQLRAAARQTSGKAMVVKKVQNVEKNSKSVDKWIRAISDLHHRKPPPTVHFTKPMPNVDNLMDIWPEKVEELLNTMSIPNSEIDCDLSTYVNILCALFDIPVYDSQIQSLHALFNLYLTMKSTEAQLVQESDDYDNK